MRFRIDGLLSTVMTPPLSLKDAVTSRIKIMAKLDISEKRLPQDGRMKIRMKKEGRVGDLDLRVSVLPTLHGEKVVLRLLDRDRLMLDMTQLGFEPESLRRFESAILKPYGMVLVTGPTGSGKTSTLYSSITRLNRTDTNILTAEDPVEFNLPGINQVQVKEQIGLTFATALRAFLRQDPNIVLVGEVRDLEDGRDRDQGGFDRTPGAQHSAHQRCRFHRQPPHQYGGGVLPGGDLGPFDLCPAADPPHLPPMQASRRPSG